MYRILFLYVILISQINWILFDFILVWLQEIYTLVHLTVYIVTLYFVGSKNSKETLLYSMLPPKSTYYHTNSALPHKVRTTPQRQYKYAHSNIFTGKSMPQKTPKISALPKIPSTVRTHFVHYTSLIHVIVFDWFENNVFIMKAQDKQKYNN